MITFIKFRQGVRGRYLHTSDGKKLPGILVVHGWQSGNPFGENGTNAKIQEALQEVGFNSLLIALSGHSPSEGSIDEVTREEHLGELREALKWLSSASNIDPLAIGACGTSYGAYLLSILAATAGFKAIALRAAALYPDLGWDEPSIRATKSPSLQAWREMRHTVDESKALSGIAKANCPIALFASANDEQMPPAVTESYLTAAPSAELFVIKGAKHTLDRDQTQEFLRLLKSWFESKSDSLR